MIPKIIWQTYKDSFNELPQYVKDATQTWKNLNPEYKYLYMNDEEIRNFILHEFNEEWLNIFNSYPLGVMRGDLWRYMIVYIYGGVYADIDTICNKPIDTWINKNKDLIVCIDDDKINYAQLAFAAKPKNPTIKIVLDLIKKESINKKYIDNDFVHNITGVNIWTKAIKQGLVDNHSIYCYNGDDSMLFHSDAITHLVASSNWSTEGYVQWQKEILKILEDNE